MVDTKFQQMIGRGARQEPVAADNAEAAAHQLDTYLETGDLRHAAGALERIEGPMSNEDIAHMIETSQETGRPSFGHRALASLATRNAGDKTPG